MEMEGGHQSIDSLVVVVCVWLCILHEVNISHTESHEWGFGVGCREKTVCDYLYAARKMYYVC